MCSPEIASRCARLEARSASSVAPSMPDRSPVTIAAAKAPVATRKRGLDPAGNVDPATPSSGCPARPSRAALDLQHGRAGIADGAEPAEPGMPPEVEPAGLHRALRGRQVRREHDAHARPRLERSPARRGATPAHAPECATAGCARARHGRGSAASCRTSTGRPRRCVLPPGRSSGSRAQVPRPRCVRQRREDQPRQNERERRAVAGAGPTQRQAAAAASAAAAAAASIASCPGSTGSAK